jgi:hypothetical protein
MKRVFILSVLFFCLVQRSFSQSEFISRGQSGYTGGFGLRTDREKNGLNFFAGYSYHGFIDATLTYAKANGGRIQGGVFTPGMTFYLTKQEDAENIPTLGISIGFSRYLSKTTETVIVPDTVIVTWRSYERVTELTLNSLKLGVTAQSRTGFWNVFFFQPLLGTELSVTNSGSEFRLRGGISIGSRVVHGPLIIVTPCLERQSGLTTFVLTVGAVF